MLVPPHESPRRHYARRVVLLDDEGSGTRSPRASDRSAADHRRLAPAVLAAEVGAADPVGLAHTRPLQEEPLRHARGHRDPARDHAECNEVDRLAGPGAVAIGAL